MLEIKNYTNIAEFKKDVIPFLMEKEVENNLPLGILTALNNEDVLPAVMAVLKKDKKIAVVLLQTHPRQIIIAKGVPMTLEEVRELGDRLHKKFPNIPGFIGEKELAQALATYIAELRNTTFYIEMNQRIYKLEQLQKKANETGRLRKIEKGDTDLIREWVYLFCEEVNLLVTREEAKEKTGDLLKKNGFYGWEVNGKLVSMANVGRSTENNTSINFVYTPVGERQKGYASDCVSALTEHQLKKGFKTTCLYTDLSNPTSNKIYQEIGYQPVMDSIVVLFEKKPT